MCQCPRRRSRSAPFPVELARVAVATHLGLQGQEEHGGDAGNASEDVEETVVPRYAGPGETAASILSWRFDCVRATPEGRACTGIDSSRVKRASMGLLARVGLIDTCCKLNTIWSGCAALEVGVGDGLCSLSVVLVQSPSRSSRRTGGATTAPLGQGTPGWPRRYARIASNASRSKGFMAANIGAKSTGVKRCL